MAGARGKLKVEKNPEEILALDNDNFYLDYKDIVRVELDELVRSTEIVVRGIALRANIIPVKVLETYNFPGFTGPAGVTIGTDRMVAAGIRYATEPRRRRTIYGN